MKNNQNIRGKNLRMRKAAIELEMIAWWIIGFAVLVLVVVGYLIITGKFGGALEHIKNLFRFRGG